MDDSHLSQLIRDPALEQLELSLRRANFFSILRITDREIRHSNFLAWLFDPNEGHSLTTIFLRWFLKDIFADNKVNRMSEFDVDNMDLSRVVVLREWKHIDILIDHPEFVVCVENKLYSAEHSNQLKRYRDILERDYPKKPKVYVLLSPYRLGPEDDEDAALYVVYTYTDIQRNLGTVLSVYGDSLPPKVRFYIEDYLEVILRDIMKEGQLVELARQIYRNHSEAIDFILENKPDRLTEVGPIFDDAIKRRGFIPCAPNKGRARFLTPALKKLIPRNGSGGWRDAEAFLFEIVYWPKQIKFQSVVSPGDPKTREALSKALSSLPGATSPRGDMWLVHFKNAKKLDVTDEKFEDDATLAAEIDSLLDANVKTIHMIESAISKALS